jgi:hypothetical protein
MCIQLRGMETHLSAALKITSGGRSVWPDINVTQWPKRVIDVPFQKDRSDNNISIVFTVRTSNEI